VPGAACTDNRGGGEGNRTPVQGFAGPCLNHSATPPEGTTIAGTPLAARPRQSGWGVRYVTPVISFMRTVTEDHTYRGVDFVAGDRVFLLYQSANRDEDVFDAPDELRVDRDHNPHLAFGIGTHYCLGANLARAEIKVVFEELFHRLRDIRAVDPDTLERGDSTLVLALNRLPAVFTPETPVSPETPETPEPRP
jgi:hypothetical protein